ncbi:type 1 fimbrial protein [Escherichia coli]|nr:type 1 fimbrial protein [Escherichia coli]EFU4621066.1 type 1 fimbrial protein [Escherichia coli]EGY3901316.1 type 1 fimbrial protein [Escherichia coli]EKQ3773284.1 type 1 fimbrial protein [Escherichia coli]ELX1874295.1 type 1 fimbrial protein [Escherichia coli]
MNFTVNVEPPVCKLKETELSVNFGEFQVSDIVMENVKQTAEFFFIDCTNVNNIKISFSGDKVDSNNNLIKNKSGGNYASGVAIGLYANDGKRIQFEKEQNISIDGSGSFYYSITAEVMKDSKNAVVTPGNIDTSVNLNITYN